MSICLRHVTTPHRISKVPLKFILQPKKLCDIIPNLNLRNLVVCCLDKVSSTNFTAKGLQYRIATQNQFHNRYLHTTSALDFSSHLYERENDSDIRRRKKMGSLRSGAKRTDWQETEEFIETLISERGDEEWANDDWIKLSEKLSVIFKGSWETMCMIRFYKGSNLAIGLSLMDFVQSRPEEPPWVLVTYFIGLLGRTSAGNTVQEEKMKSYYDDMISKAEVLDSLTMEILSKGLSYTSYYRECLTLVTKAIETDTLSSVMLMNSLIGGLRNSDHDMCTTTLSHFDDKASSGPFLLMLPQIVDEALACGNEEGLKLFLSFIERQGVMPKRSVVQTMGEIFERYDPSQWHGSFGKVSHITGRCSLCRQQMEEIEITDEEFKDVQSAFLDQVIVSDNIFYKSTPKEVESFISFVDAQGPFDVVIDGLNTLFVNGLNRRNKNPDPYMLLQIESHFTSQGLKVLILGSRFLRTILKGKKLQSTIYTTDTTQADDAFFLYAALHSGKNTLIVSADKLRDHKYRLDPKLRPIFERWLKLVQVFDFFVHSRTDNMILKRRNFRVGPIEDASGWHFPFDDTNEYEPFGRNGVLCLRHGPDNFVMERKQPYKPYTGKGPFRDNGKGAFRDNGKGEFRERRPRQYDSHDRFPNRKGRSNGPSPWYED